MYFLRSIMIAALSSLTPLTVVYLIFHFAYLRRIQRTASCFLLSLYFSAVYYVTGLPTVLFTTFDPEFYLLPLIGILFDLRNSFLNIILFLPLGFLVPLFSERFRSLRAVLILGLTCSLFIEVAQMFTYRLSDVNDLITNTLGAVLGYRLIRPVVRKNPSIQSLNSKDLVFSAVTSVCSMYFLQPLLSAPLWSASGQIFK